ncbi:hypothetical protein GPALN_010341 [Globodera pallida]|nr:hypothetical protein GPALN_010341 [Globodera pallida]
MSRSPVFSRPAPSLMYTALQEYVAKNLDENSYDWLAYCSSAGCLGNGGAEHNRRQGAQICFGQAKLARTNLYCCDSFSRFYFVGDEDLLEILGNSKNLIRIRKSKIGGHLNPIQLITILLSQSLITLDKLTGAAPGWLFHAAYLGQLFIPWEPPQRLHTQSSSAVASTKPHGRFLRAPASIPPPQIWPAGLHTSGQTAADSNVVR